MPGWMKSGWEHLPAPVVAAAVILAPRTTIDGLADSKLLSPKRREKLFAVISAGAVAIGIGRTDVEEVDRLNIYWAAMEARRRAVEALPTRPAHILVDEDIESPAVGLRRRRWWTVMCSAHRLRQRRSWPR